MQAHAPACTRNEPLLPYHRSSWCRSGRRRAMQRSGCTTQVMGPMACRLCLDLGALSRQTALPNKGFMLQVSAAPAVHNLSSCSWRLGLLTRSNTPHLLPWPSTHAAPGPCRRAGQQQGAAEVCAGGLPVVCDAPHRRHAGAVHGQRPFEAQGAPKVSSSTALFNVYAVVSTGQQLPLPRSAWEV